MQRVEQRLAITPPTEQKEIEIVKVQEQAEVFELIERLAMPELRFEERLSIAIQLRKVLGIVNKNVLPDKRANYYKVVVS
jgi:hypothetical protein